MQESPKPIDSTTPNNTSRLSLVEPPLLADYSNSIELTPTRKHVRSSNIRYSYFPTLAGMVPINTPKRKYHKVNPT